MRVCFVSRRFFPTISGMSVYAANLLRELVRDGHGVTMLAQYRGDPDGRRIYGGGPPPPVPGVEVIGMDALGEQAGGDFERDVETLAARIVEEHRRTPFDVIHAQYGYPTGLAALEASRRTGVPNVVSIQGGDGHWVGTCCATHRAAIRTVFDHAGALLIGSRSFRDEVVERHGVEAGRFTIVPGAVDVGRFRPATNGDGPPGDVPVLLFHGRVDERKGALDLVDAFARLDRPARLLFSGLGPDSARVSERVAELGLDGGVQVAGPADYEHVPAVYRRADVFVSPTYAEGFSNTILEAMASGVPIVSTRAVGVTDCLRDGDNALLVPPGDPAALASALRRALDQPALRARLAGRALAEVREKYSWRAAATRIESVYQEAATHPPDVDWTMPNDRAPCRFRVSPHLL